MKMKKLKIVNSFNNINKANKIEQRPNPDAEELRISQRNLDIVQLINI